MKKALSFILSAVLLLWLVGCGKSQSTVTTPATGSVSSAEKPTKVPTEATTEKPTKASTEAPTDPPQSNIEWTQTVYTVEDTAGYKYEITIKLTPWIFHTNSSLIDSAWKQVGNNNSLPRSFSDWGLKKQGNAYRKEALTDIVSGYLSYPYVAPMTDMYYCLGSVSVNNVTDGWNITTSEPRTLKFSIEYESSLYQVGTDVIGRIYYSSEKNDCSSGLYVSPKLTSNHWGPCSFVLMAPENITPKTPNGDHYDSLLDKDSYFKFFGLNLVYEKSLSNIRIGVIGENGQYVEPKNG